MGLYNILVDIQASTANLEAGLNRAQSQIDSFTNKVKGIVEILGVMQFAEFVEHTIEAGAALERAAQKAGVGGKAFSELSYAAKQSGVETDQLSSAMTKMNKALSEASTGAQGPTQALAALGLTFSDLKNLSPDQQLEVIADRISRLPTPADKARVEIALFGKAGAELAPLLDQGAKGIENLRGEADRLGAAFSDDLLKKMEEAHQSITRMESSAGAAATTFISRWTPAITTFTDSVTALMTGDKLLQLKSQIEALQQMSSEHFGVGNLMGGVESWIAKKRLPALEQQLFMLQQVEETDRRVREYNPDMSSLLGGNAPGYQDTQNIPELKSAKVYIAEVQDELDRFYANWDSETQTAVEREANAFEHFSNRVKVLIENGMSPDEGQKRISAKLDELLPEFQVTAKKMKEEFKYEMSDMEKLGLDAAQSLQDDFAQFLFEPFHNGGKKMAEDFLKQLHKMASDAAAKSIFKLLFGDDGNGSNGSGKGNGGGSGLGGYFAKGMQALGGGGSGGSGALNDLVSQKGVIGAAMQSLFGGNIGLTAAQNADLAASLDTTTAATMAANQAAIMAGTDAAIAGAMADGGSVNAGSTYLVGEAGPELFTAASHGNITSNADLTDALSSGNSGDVHIHNHIDARGADADRIMKVLPPLLAAHGARTKADILNAFRRTGLAAPVKA